jgi:SEC-C motif-containing protein
MRSRYSAFAIGDTDYLLRTWHPRTRPQQLSLDPAQRWAGLEILGKTGGGLLQTTGTVEFRASYRRGKQRGEQHENSTFVRENGLWLYVEARER